MSYPQSFARASLIGSLIFSSCAMATGQDPDQPKKVVISFEIDDGPVRIVIRGDDVKVELYGKPISKERLQRERDLDRGALRLKAAWEVILEETPVGLDLRAVVFACVPRFELSRALATVG